MKYVEVDPATGDVVRMGIRPDGAAPMRREETSGNLFLEVPDFRSRRYVDGALVDHAPRRHVERVREVPVPPRS